MTAIRQRFERVLLGNLDLLLERYFAYPDYPLIDMKLNLIDGGDFDDLPAARRGLKGREAVYAWIQGRGLEALAGHAVWLSGCNILSETDKRSRLEKIAIILCEVSAEMERIRQANGGRLFFCMDRQGNPLEPNGAWDDFHRFPKKVSTMSDLFYCKGFLAATSYLRDHAGAAKAVARFGTILADIENDRFVNDQIFWGRSEDILAARGRRSHAARMIALGGLSLFQRLTGDNCYLRTADAFICRILSGHVNLGRFAGLQQYDFVEFLQSDGSPWEDGGRIMHMSSISPRLPLMPIPAIIPV